MGGIFKDIEKNEYTKIATQRQTLWLLFLTTGKQNNPIVLE